MPWINWVLIGIVGACLIAVAAIASASLIDNGGAGGGSNETPGRASECLTDSEMYRTLIELGYPDSGARAGVEEGRRNGLVC
jgi:hypothetical protein